MWLISPSAFFPSAYVEGGQTFSWFLKQIINLVLTCPGPYSPAAILPRLFQSKYGVAHSLCNV